MGYTFLPNTFVDNKDFYLKEIKPGYNSSVNVSVIDYSIRGNVVYELLEIKTETSTEFLIGVTKISRMKEDNSIGFKLMDETCGPAFYDCPQKYLKKSTSNSEFAVNWRKKCYEHIKLKKEEKSINKKMEEQLAGKQGCFVIMDNGVKVKYHSKYTDKRFVGIPSEKTNQMFAYRYKDIKEIL